MDCVRRAEMPAGGRGRGGKGILGGRARGPGWVDGSLIGSSLKAWQGWTQERRPFRAGRVAGMKRKCSDSAVQTITGNTSKRCVIEINVADHDSFTVDCCITEDPNEYAEAHNVLFGILQADRIRESFDVENDVPTHGLFL